jgi:hypothetical protein
MANNYNQVAAIKSLTCTDAESLEIAQVLNNDAETKDCYHGFEIEYSGDQLYIFAEESGTPEELSEEVRKLIGKLITKNELPYLQFGYAFTCSKMRMGEFGGGEFRIYPNGDLVWPFVIWPESPAWEVVCPEEK